MLNLFHNLHENVNIFWINNYIFIIYLLQLGLHTVAVVLP
jgi:hypothetical protein